MSLILLRLKKLRTLSDICDKKKDMKRMTLLCILNTHCMRTLFTPEHVIYCVTSVRKYFMYI